MNSEAEEDPYTLISSVESNKIAPYMPLSPSFREKVEREKRNSTFNSLQKQNDKTKYRFKESELAILKKKFEKIASNGEKLSREGFRKIMGVLGLESASFLSDRIFDIIDIKAGGELQLPDFLRFMDILINGDEKEKSEFSFNMLKSNNSKVELEFKDFQQSMNQVLNMWYTMTGTQVTYSEKAMNDLFNQLDEDKDGKVNLEEYHRIMTINPEIFQWFEILNNGLLHTSDGSDPSISLHSLNRKSTSNSNGRESLSKGGAKRPHNMDLKRDENVNAPYLDSSSYTKLTEAIGELQKLKELIEMIQLEETTESQIIKVPRSPSSLYSSHSDKNMFPLAGERRNISEYGGSERPSGSGYIQSQYLFHSEELPSRTRINQETQTEEIDNIKSVCCCGKGCSLYNNNNNLNKNRRMEVEVDKTNKVDITNKTDKTNKANIRPIKNIEQPQLRYFRDYTYSSNGESSPKFPQIISISESESSESESPKYRQTTGSLRKSEPQISMQNSLNSYISPNIYPAGKIRSSLTEIRSILKREKKINTFISIPDLVVSNNVKLPSGGIVSLSNPTPQKGGDYSDIEDPNMVEESSDEEDESSQGEEVRGQNIPGVSKFGIIQSKLLPEPESSPNMSYGKWPAREGAIIYNSRYEEISNSNHSNHSNKPKNYPIEKLGTIHDIQPAVDQARVDEDSHNEYIRRNKIFQGNSGFGDMGSGYKFGCIGEPEGESESETFPFYSNTHNTITVFNGNAENSENMGYHREVTLGAGTQIVKQESQSEHNPHPPIYYTGAIGSRESILDSMSSSKDSIPRKESDPRQAIADESGYLMEEEGLGVSGISTLPVMNQAAKIELREHINLIQNALDGLLPIRHSTGEPLFTNISDQFEHNFEESLQNIPDVLEIRKNLRKFSYDPAKLGIVHMPRSLKRSPTTKFSRADTILLKDFNSNKKKSFVNIVDDNWNLVLNMMIGIRNATKGINENELKSITLTDQHFTIKFVYELIPKRTNHTKKKMYKFYDYSPSVFGKIRHLYQIYNEEYMRALGPEQIIGNLIMGNILTLQEHMSSGKSGSFFYYSPCGRFIMKTISREEFTFMRKLLKPYYCHLLRYPHTLLSRFLGLHKIRIGRSEIYFIVMANCFNTYREIHMRFDLKGSTQGRKVKQHTNQFIDPAIALKDLDILNEGIKISLDPSLGRLMTKQIKYDCDFLKEKDIIDYSLLFGIHNVSNSNLNMTAEILRFEEKLDHFKSKNGEIVNKDITEFLRKSIPQGGCPFYELVDGGMASIKGDKVLFFGMIDILTHYGTRKKMEHAWKLMQTMGNQMSCVPPKYYARRFKNFVYGLFDQQPTHTDFLDTSRTTNSQS